MNIPLGGQMILVLQYHTAIGLDVADILTYAGAKILGPFRLPRDAYRAIPNSGVRAAVVGANFGRGLTSEPALAVAAKGVSVVIHTGYRREDLPLQLRRLPYLAKPLACAALVRAVAQACGL